ncbi:hypothetical protein [Hydrogenovibrio sp. JE_KL2]|uniref:hypothetical protein n=1 Tax=Hydrogenovibrio sp. JE_KL2 TaxID=2651188 RepID=UPI00128CB45E|nr:hypothetical protein [Hydrogenovibrio sp. JE_KL2]MPQ76055.1 hypothetical protein [Hydrogenovibrio sp. JE_KL2]
MKKILMFSLLSVMLTAVSSAYAQQFKVNDTILIAFPANNIKDDAYIVGVVRKIRPNGDYQIAVQDFVEGHDYGISCQPIAVNSEGQDTGQSGWQIWGKDHTKLRTQGLDYIVPAKRAMPLRIGQLNFIDRYNVYVLYSRWKSNAPVLSIDRIKTAENDAKMAGISPMIPALEIAILDRQSYYDKVTGIPYQPEESIPHLVKLFDYIQTQLKQDPELNKLWRAKKRDWKKINESMKTYFLVDAIDQAVSNAEGCLSEDTEKADPKELKKLKSQLKALGIKI